MPVRVFALLVVLCASAPALAADPAPFPVPSVDGKPLALEPGQRTFRLPFRLARLERFYRDRFRGEAKVTLLPSQQDGRRVLTLKSKRPTDSWTKAILRESDVGTTVEITPVLRFSDEKVEGNGRPLVELVLTRSEEAGKLVNSIDHLER